MLPDPIADPLGSFRVNHLGSPGGGIDMAMAASLIAFAANIQLERP
jgi:hypothetical protein